MIYIAAFGLVFCGFCLGVLVAALCCAAGKASRREEYFNPGLQKITPPKPWPDSDDEWKSARDAYQGKAEREI
jgi:hypothetical protein